MKKADLRPEEQRRINIDRFVANWAGEGLSEQIQGWMRRSGQQRWRQYMLRRARRDDEGMTKGKSDTKGRTMAKMKVKQTEITQ